MILRSYGRYIMQHSYCRASKAASFAGVIPVTTANLLILICKF